MRQLLRQLALDAIGLGGVGLTVLGVHRIYPPAALILGGLLLAGFALLFARPRAP